MGINIGVFIPVSALLMHSRQPYLLISQFFFVHSKMIITCENKSWEVEPRNEATCSMYSTYSHVVLQHGTSVNMLLSWEFFLDMGINGCIIL